VGPCTSRGTARLGIAPLSSMYRCWGAHRAPHGEIMVRCRTKTDAPANRGGPSDHLATAATRHRSSRGRYGSPSRPPHLGNQSERASSHRTIESSQQFRQLPQNRRRLGKKAQSAARGSCPRSSNGPPRGRRKVGRRQREMVGGGRNQCRGTLNHTPSLGDGRATAGLAETIPPLLSAEGRPRPRLCLVRPLVPIEPKYSGSCPYHKRIGKRAGTRRRQ